MGYNWPIMTPALSILTFLKLTIELDQFKFKVQVQYCIQIQSQHTSQLNEPVLLTFIMDFKFTCIRYLQNLGILTLLKKTGLVFVIISSIV